MGLPFPVLRERFYDSNQEDQVSCEAHPIGSQATFEIDGLAQLWSHRNGSAMLPDVYESSVDEWQYEVLVQSVFSLDGGTPSHTPQKALNQESSFPSLEDFLQLL